MTLRLRLGGYLLGLHVLLFGAAAFLLIDRPLLFVGAEALLLASLAAGFALLRQALEPLGYTRRFHDLLQDQNYANRLAAPASPELDAALAAIGQHSGPAITRLAAWAGMDA